MFVDLHVCCLCDCCSHFVLTLKCQRQTDKQPKKFLLFWSSKKIFLTTWRKSDESGIPCWKPLTINLLWPSGPEKNVYATFTQTTVITVQTLVLFLVWKRSDMQSAAARQITTQSIDEIATRNRFRMIHDLVARKGRFRLLFSQLRIDGRSKICFQSNDAVTLRFHG